MRRTAKNSNTLTFVEICFFSQSILAFIENIVPVIKNTAVKRFKVKIDWEKLHLNVMKVLNFKSSTVVLTELTLFVKGSTFPNSGNARVSTDASKVQICPYINLSLNLGAAEEMVFPCIRLTSQI